MYIACLPLPTDAHPQSPWIPQALTRAVLSNALPKEAYPAPSPCTVRSARDSRTVGVDSGEVGAAVDERAEDRGAAVLRRLVQRRVALDVARVHRRAGGEEALRGRRVAALGGPVERRPAEPRRLVHLRAARRAAQSCTAKRGLSAAVRRCDCYGAEAKSRGPVLKVPALVYTTR